ncbi:MAG: DUF4349 domain-containing protein [Chloroflexi bacterium]|nr:DUF4349 domain-containing protein [Chloroflexota bacterium]
MKTKGAAISIAAFTLLIAGAACAPALKLPGGEASGASGREASAPPANEALDRALSGNQTDAPKAQPAPARPGAAPAAPAPAPSAGTGTSGDAALTGLLDRKIAYNAQINLQVQDLDGSFQAVADLARQMGGFVASSNQKGDVDKPQATLSIRVPVARYEDAMAALRRLGAKVEQESATARDVTEEYTDLEARVRNLEFTEARYKELMAQAKTLDEVLRVQQLINNVRSEIDRTQGRLNVLSRLTDLATIDVRLAPVPPPRKSTSTFDPGAIIADAWEDSLVFWRGLGRVVLYLAVAGWWLWIPLGLLAAGLIRWGKRQARPRGA